MLCCPKHAQQPGSLGTAAESAGGIQTPGYLDPWVGQCIDLQKHDWLLALIYMKGLRNGFHHLGAREEPGKKQDPVLILTEQVSKL